MSQVSPVRFGIVSTGAIASCFAQAIGASTSATLQAVCSRSAKNAADFAAKYGAAVSYDDYHQMLAGDQIDAVYVATPHPWHAEYAIAAAAAGKHVLVEKPIATSHAEAMLIAEAARANNVLVAEAFMYRCHPQAQALVDLLRRRVIGDVQFIESNFSFRAGPNLDPKSWLINPELGGGGILNMGGYALSMAMLIAGAATGKAYAEPQSIKGSAVIGETGVDLWASATLVFPGKIVAQVGCGHQLNHANDVRIFGTEGQILVPAPWTANRQQGGSFQIQVIRGGKVEATQVQSDRTAFTLEAERFAAAVQRGARSLESPAASLEESLAIQRGLDAWRAQAGVVYPFEKPQGLPPSRAGTPRAFADAPAIPTRSLPGLDKPVSRLVMGVDNQTQLAHAAVMFDAYVAQGGTTFDTAYVYGGGVMERLLGQWMKARQCRRQVVVIAKGAVTPYCLPDMIGVQLEESLGRLQTNHADLYIMHRDNTDVPAGEFVDALNALRDKGILKLFGGSNWTLPRIKEANEYARRTGKQPFTLLSDNFSLARMVNPVWGGCVAASTDEFREWLTESQTVSNFAWSSQARGFFTDRAAPDKRDDFELANSWYSDDNFERRRRAVELAGQLGVAPINIALAYVLCQPFQQFALVGPRTLEELRTTLTGLTIELTSEQMAWLDLRRPVV